MINPDCLTINIIYVKGTVSMLIPFFNSLYAHSQCRYRLISNGCDEDEKHQLQMIAEELGRVEFYHINSTTILPHHDILNELLTLEKSEYFIFSDSDICANGDFLQEAFSLMKDQDAFFSGYPIWHTQNEEIMPKNFRILGGRFPKTHNGIIVGFSYFAIYKRSTLIKFIDNSRVSFERHTWSTVPVNLKPLLLRNQLKKSFYDTGKLLNALMYLEGHKLSYAKLNTLKHLGGISGITTQKNKNKVKHLLFQKRRLISVWARIIIRYSKNIKTRRMSLRESANIDELVTKRIFTEAYFKAQVEGKDNLTDLSKSKTDSNLHNDIEEIVSIVRDKTAYLEKDLQ